MSKRWSLVVVAVMAGALLGAGGPTAVIEKVPSKSAQEGKVGGEAQIDWTNRLITVTGMGPLATNVAPALAKVRARRIAIGDALRLLAEAVSGVRVTSETKIANYELVSDDVHLQMTAFVRGQQVIEEKLTEDGIFTVKMVAPLFGGGDNSVASIVLPAIEQTEEPARQAREKEDQEAGRQPVPPVDIPEKPPVAPATPARKPGPYTGLIVDARGFDLMSSMSPKIVRKDETEVWGTVHVSTQFVLQNGIVGWVPNLESAKRSGDNPLIIRAIGCHGSFRANPIVGDDDADLILKENAKSKYLDTFKVCIVKG
ncbi:MAG: hypothetical protein HYU66_03205 [Armatimonadetes bacterium]|nr:hypothetical protein [Armatimonadota bacterium]